MFVLTEGLLILFCIIYRRRPGHRPSYTHGSKVAEVTWTIVPALMLLTIAIVQIGTWNHIKKEMPAPGPGVTEVRALAQQYQWNIQYPNTKAKVEGAENDISTVGVMHIPFGDKALVYLRSSDVIHSMFIPQMRVKQDLVPGLRQKLWFQTNRIKLIDLKKAPSQDGGKRMDAGHEGEPRPLQEFVWINNPKELEKGGSPYASKTIAVDGYLLNKDTGIYETKKAKVRILKDGALTEGAWADCDYCLGIFEIACAELCGLGHYKMRGQLIVEPRVSFDAWLKDQGDNDLPDAFKHKQWKFPD
jgi:heme/copper-type cytochrome/quinol oxidase subunit 2